MNTENAMGIQDNFGNILDELRDALSVINDADAEKLATAVSEAQSVFVAGGGRSGLAMRSFAMRLMHLGYNVHVVGETTTPGITDKDLLIVGSGSGATRSLIAHAKAAHSMGASVALITIDKDSTIAGIADPVLTIAAPSNKIAGKTGFKSIQPLGSLFEQGLLLTLDGIVLLLMEATGEDSAMMFKRHANLE